MALIAGAGCGATSSGPEEQAGPEYGLGLVVHVENHSIHDATITAVSGPHRATLGIAPPDDERTFTFQWPRTRIRFEIRPITGGTRLTDEVLVGDGDELRLRIEPDSRGVIGT
jgi:hypothetical protein